jgi:hypothetical protein
MNVRMRHLQPHHAHPDAVARHHLGYAPGYFLRAKGMIAGKHVIRQIEKFVHLQFRESPREWPFAQRINVQKSKKMSASSPTLWQGISPRMMRVKMLGHQREMSSTSKSP